jgi:hypothetical protein
VGGAGDIILIKKHKTKKVRTMVAPVYTLYMDQNRLGPLEKPLRMTDMSVMLRREEKENNKKKRSKNYRKKRNN